MSRAPQKAEQCDPRAGRARTSYAAPPVARAELEVGERRAGSRRWRSRAAHVDLGSANAGRWIQACCGLPPPRRRPRLPRYEVTVLVARLRASRTRACAAVPWTRIVAFAPRSAVRIDAAGRANARRAHRRTRSSVGRRVRRASTGRPARARERTRRERSREEPRVVVRPTAHVRERQAGARPLASPRRPRRRIEPSPRQDVEHRAFGVMRDAAVPLALVGLRNARRRGRRAAERGRRVGRLAAASPPWPSRGRCRRCPARSRTPRLRSPAPSPTRAPTRRSTHRRRRRSRRRRDRGRASSPRARSSRTVSDSATGSAPPASWT